jgi:hypothetical protein
MSLGSEAVRGESGSRSVPMVERESGSRSVPRVDNSVETLPIGRFEKEDQLLETIRQHLREAWRNRAVGRMTFEFEFNRGGVGKAYIGMDVHYRFLTNV